MFFNKKSQEQLEIIDFINNVSKVIKKYNQRVIKEKDYSLRTITIFRDKFNKILLALNHLLEKYEYLNTGNLNKELKQLKASRQQLIDCISNLDKAIKVLEKENEI